MVHDRPRTTTVVILLMACWMLTPVGLGADGEQSDSTQPTKEVGQEKATSSKPAVEPEASKSAEAVLKKVLEQRRATPTIKPTDAPVWEDGTAEAPARTGGVDVDPNVLGTAPGLPRPKLRREGEFIPLRRGRLVRSPSSGQVLFVFEADAKRAEDPPMGIMPCGALESMEREVRLRGDKQVFLVSGQVFTYRSANYLLPTMWKLPANIDNLQK